jgi:thymidine phosphorylase
MYSAQEIILQIREGRPLSQDQIAAFVAGVCDGTVTDAQIAAFAMATWFRGMSPDEQMSLTLAIRDSGAVLQWPDLPGPVVDKHSTGGVGDLVSLILAPLLAACGAYVPMISGRGLGHTGGTLDKLESIPGFQTAPSIARLVEWVSEHGLAIVGQSAQLVPADRRFYAVRDETATVASIPLIVSSILSKKLAEGLDALVMDIKFGCGAFMASAVAAGRLAQEICDVARVAGLRCNALITDMDQPLAWSAGNAVEVREAIQFLRGDARNERLLSVVLELAAELLALSGLASDLAEGRAMALQKLDSGHAAERFAVMVRSQGGPGDLMEDPEASLPVARVIRPVPASRDGFISHIDTRAVGMVVVHLGGGRLRAEDHIDPAVGLSALLPLGQAVDERAPLAIVHAANEAAWEEAATALHAAVTIGQDKPANVPVVVDRVGAW